MKQLLVFAALLFMWNTDASSRSVSPEHRDDDDSVTVVEVSKPADEEQLAAAVAVNIPSDTMALQLPSFGIVPGVTQGGVSWMNEKAADIYKNLTEDQQRYIVTCALAGNFSPGSVAVKFWKVVACISDPVGNLAKVAVVVLPLLASAKYGYYASDSEEHKEYNSLAIATSVAGVVSLTCDKICSYANDKIASQEKILICLQAMKQSRGNVGQQQPQQP